MRSRRCLGWLAIKSQLRRAVRGKSDVSEPQCATKVGIQRLSLMCKNQNTIKVERSAGVEFSRKWHTKLCPKSQQSQPHIPLERASKVLQQEKIQTNSKTPFLKTATKLLTKETRSVTLRVDTTLGTKRNRYATSFCKTRLSTCCPLTTTKIHAACQNLVLPADPHREGVQVPSACFASLGFVTLPCPLQNMR